MHHNRSLLPDIEVLLSVTFKTSRCSTKLLFVILNFYSWKNNIFFTKFQNFYQISKFLPNFWITTNFFNDDKISELQPYLWITTKFHNFNQISEFQPNFGISIKFHNFHNSHVSGDFPERKLPPFTSTPGWCCWEINCLQNGGRWFKYNWLIVWFKLQL